MAQQDAGPADHRFLDRSSLLIESGDKAVEFSDQSVRRHSSLVVATPHQRISLVTGTPLIWSRTWRGSARSGAARRRHWEAAGVFPDQRLAESLDRPAVVSWSITETYRSILGLRAIRDYQDRPVSQDDLDRVLEAARWTGSAKNLQKWAVVVVHDRDQIERVADCGKRHHAAPGCTGDAGPGPGTGDLRARHGTHGAEHKVGDDSSHR